MRNKVVVFICLIIVIGLGGLVTKLPKTVAPITSIECKVEQEPCPEIAHAALQPLLNQSLLFTKLEPAIAQLSLQQYELVSIQKKLLGTLILTFKPKKNLYILVMENGEKWVIAESGYAQQSSQTETLPEVFISSHWPQSIHEQQLDAPTHQLVQQILATLSQSHIAVQKIELRSPTEIALTLPNNVQALLSNEQTESQIRKLSLILSNLDLATIDTGIRTIDLRFKLPILKT